MRIVYLILAHRYPEQLARLIDALDGEGISFLVHVDRRSGAHMFQTVREQLGGRPNLRFVPRVRCRWGAFGIVRATLNGITTAIEQEGSFDYLALLSGQDYPIKTNDFIRSFLAARRGTSFISHHPFPFAEWKHEEGGWDRVRYWSFRPWGRLLVFPRERTFRFRVVERLWSALIAAFPLRRRFPAGYHPYGGAQFWCLARPHARYIYDFVRQNRDFVRFFRRVVVPDEIFFQTILANSHLRAELCNKSLTFVEWYRPGATLISSDFDNLRASTLIFARKFDESVDAAIIDRVDRELLGRANPPPPRAAAHLEN